MSTRGLEELICTIRQRMGETYTYKEYDTARGYSVTEGFFYDVNMLEEQYGKYIGKVRAINKGDKEIDTYDAYISQCFEGLLKTSIPDTCFQLINLAIGKISQVIAYTQTLESLPKDMVSKELFDQMTSEKNQFEKTAEFLAKHGGFPEVDNLLKSAKDIGLPVNKDWVLALCSINLIEAIVNAKFEKFGVKIEESLPFKDKYRKLCDTIKLKEGRDISQLLPIALYTGVRNKLDHASNANRVSEKEAKDISRLVIEFMNEVIPSET